MYSSIFFLKKSVLKQPIQLFQDVVHYSEEIKKQKNEKSCKYKFQQSRRYVQIPDSFQ